MKTNENTNGSQALDGALALAQPASDGDVSNSSDLPAEFTGMYRACYETGYASGQEVGYRQGYRAGFEDGRRQGGDGISAAPAAVENMLGQSEVAKSEVGNCKVENSAPGMRKARLFGFPCTKCGKWFFSDEARCPRCETPRVTSAGPASATRCD